MGLPTIYPTGTTIYKPEKCWNGFTIFPASGEGVMLIDMNGREIKLWKNVNGFPVKMLKDGHIMAQVKERPWQEMLNEYEDLSEIDWDGNIVWQYKEREQIQRESEEPQWIARYKSDFQREGNPVGYYTPELECKINGGNTLLLVHRNVHNDAITKYELLDDCIIEVDWNGNLLWEWCLSDHFDELGLSDAGKKVLAKKPFLRPAYNGTKLVGDWMHINNMCTLGPNKWYESGDERFHPDNILFDARQDNIIAIISKKTGKIVWKLGPYYDSEELKNLGWIIGQHHAHMIPKGLPGAGNILVFDNGGASGYGEPNPSAPDGFNRVFRDYSRVIEFDPITFDIIWQYSPAETGVVLPMSGHTFYSYNISSAQRLPNGNTFICEGGDARFIEVTPDHEIVWEYISPYSAAENTVLPEESRTAQAKNGYTGNDGYLGVQFNWVYRAYRVPYEYAPQAPIPKEIPVHPVNLQNFRMPNAAPKGGAEIAIVPGTVDLIDTASNTNFCLNTDSQDQEVNKMLQ